MRLSQKWVDKLTALPETGMGYQVVDVYLKNGVIIEKLTLFNGEVLVNQAHGSFSENDILDIKLHQ